jgi:hypothetical protein
MHKPGSISITAAICRLGILTRMLFYKHYRWLAWPKVPLLLQQLGSWVQDRIVIADVTWHNLEMQTVDTSHVCLDDLTKSRQSLLAPELHILGPYIQCLVKIPYTYVKKTLPYQILQIERLNLSCLKRNRTTSFHFIKRFSFQNTVFLRVKSWTWFTSHRK